MAVHRLFKHYQTPRSPHHVISRSARLRANTSNATSRANFNQHHRLDCSTLTALTYDSNWKDIDFQPNISGSTENSPLFGIGCRSVSRYELNGRCSNNVSCSMERAISGYIEPVQWWYQLIDDDDDAYYIQ
jgi:hypothetical protein